MIWTWDLVRLQYLSHFAVTLVMNMGLRKTENKLTMQMQTVAGFQLCVDQWWRLVGTCPAGCVLWDWRPAVPGNRQLLPLSVRHPRSCLAEFESAKCTNKCQHGPYCGTSPLILPLTPPAKRALCSANTTFTVLENTANVKPVLIKTSFWWSKRTLITSYALCWHSEWPKYDG